MKQCLSMAMLGRWWFAWPVVVLATAAAGFSPAPAGGEERNTSPVSEVVLKHKLEWTDFGPCADLRLGELNGDNRLDIVAVRAGSNKVPGIRAVDVTGKVLWQLGVPKSADSAGAEGIPFQIYDVDQDGQNEVLYASDGMLRIVNGETGELEREAKLPVRKIFSFGFANFSGKSHAEEIMIFDRYSNVWVWDRDLKPLWSHRGNMGHYPWPFDFDGDGKDELAFGYSLLGHDGREMWTLPLPGHCDAVAIGDADGDPKNGCEIAYATCGGDVFALAGRDGKLRWKHPTRHSQHVLIGDFRPDLPGKEIAALDRGKDRSHAGVDAMLLYTHDGRELWHEKRQDSGKGRWLTMISRVDRKKWDGGEGDLIFGFRRGGITPPKLYDGNGRVVDTFPFPDTENIQVGPEEWSNLCRARHADMFGDEREEIVVYNHQWIYIYANESPYTSTGVPNRGLPNKRLYNYHAYIGMP